MEKEGEVLLRTDGNGRVTYFTIHSRLTCETLPCLNGVLIINASNVIKGGCSPDRHVGGGWSHVDSKNQHNNTVIACQMCSLVKKSLPRCFLRTAKLAQ